MDYFIRAGTRVQRERRVGESVRQKGRNKKTVRRFGNERAGDRFAIGSIERPSVCTLFQKNILSHSN